MGYILRITQTVFLVRKNVRKTRNVVLSGADQKRDTHQNLILGTVFGGRRENVLMTMMSSMIEIIRIKAILAIKVKLNM